MPLVSVIVPAFSPGDFLARSVGSVLKQTVADLECVVVDDGSPEPVDLGALGRDSRLRLIRQENMGVSVARNAGVAASDSALVAFLDQDDEWLPNKLESQVALLISNPRASFVHSPFWWVRSTLAQESGHDVITYESSLAGLGHVCLSSVLVERQKHDCVGGHNPVLAQQQDWDFVLRLIRVFGPPITAEEPLVRYFVHGQNASSDYWRAENEARCVFDLHALGGTGSVKSAIRAGRAHSRTVHSYQAVDAARSAVRATDFVAAATNLSRAVRLDPGVGLASCAATIKRRMRPSSSRERS